MGCKIVCISIRTIDFFRNLCYNGGIGVLFGVPRIVLYKEDQMNCESRPEVVECIYGVFRKVEVFMSRCVGPALFWQRLFRELLYLMTLRDSEEKVLSFLATDIVASLAAAAIILKPGKSNSCRNFCSTRAATIIDERNFKALSRELKKTLMLKAKNKEADPEKIRQIRDAITSTPYPLPGLVFLQGEIAPNLNSNFEGRRYKEHPEERLGVMIVQAADFSHLMHIFLYRGLHLPKDEQYRRLPFYYAGWGEARRYVDPIVEVLEGIGVEVDIGVVKKVFCRYATTACRYFDFVEEGGDYGEKINSQRAFEDAFKDLSYVFFQYLEPEFIAKLNRSAKYRKLIVEQLREHGCGTWRVYEELANIGRDSSPEEFDKIYTEKYKDFR